MGLKPRFFFDDLGYSGSVVEIVKKRKCFDEVRVEMFFLDDLGYSGSVVEIAKKTPFIEKNQKTKVF